ncbi:MAG TPA: ATP-binding protein [Propioniciclava sp.]|jgi:two-component system OmpR family sensor kinase|uniref:sensor histidine kinase n=1 Tax=Propioniciclava sp. TaxID=2038686 RepID=UPI002CDF2526|nr:ATP-binding protein [Propioniciclava sp.]HRL79010.1 ATP-binding protein [Propioniciclava sp.]
MAESLGGAAVGESLLCAAVVVLLIVLAGVAEALRRARRRAAELAAENRRWRALAMDRADRVAIVSHELRTPIALISGAAELLLDGTAGALSTTQHGLVDTIDVKASEVLALAADLLTDAKIDAALFQFRATTVDVRRVTTGIVRDLRHLYPNRITLSARGASPRIMGDPDLIRQALTNLITNAARHAGEEARIGVTVRPNEDGVLIIVSDDGTGMSPEQTSELFRRGLAGKSETGNGLGMLITRRIVELHGGRCLVDSAVNVGTTILCSLPRRTPERDELSADPVA